MIIFNVFGGSDLLLEVRELVSGVGLLDIRGDGNGAVNEHRNLLEILLHEAAADSEFGVSGFSLQRRITLPRGSCRTIC